MKPRFIAVLLGAILVSLSGCSSVVEDLASQKTSPEKLRAQSAQSASGPAGPVNTGVDYAADSSDDARMAELWRARTSGVPFSDFALGPGDVIVISVPAIKELSDLTVRVSAGDTITLPLLGTIQVNGLSEAGLRDEIKRRLDKYMYKPDLQLFVREYQSREVSVLGAVKKPGVITLTNPNETLWNVIGQAGGTYESADQVILIPAFPGRSTATSKASDAMPSNVMELGQQSPSEIAEILKNNPKQPFAGSNERPIVINTATNSPGGGSRYLNLPVRPGDVILIPASGDVSVIGWVYSPGHVKVIPGMGVLSAIGSAGGPLYAADRSSVTLMRNQKDGTTKAVSVDLGKIANGQEPDIPVKGNDVIEVSYATSRIVPYIFYNLLLRAPLSVPAF